MIPRRENPEQADREALAEWEESNLDEPAEDRREAEERCHRCGRKNCVC